MPTRSTFYKRLNRRRDALKIDVTCDGLNDQKFSTRRFELDVTCDARTLKSFRRDALKLT